MLFTREDVRHRGYRIVWDVRRVAGTAIWSGKAAVVLPVHVSASERVYPTGEFVGFNSEEEARDHLICAAKDWIDHQDSKIQLSQERDNSKIGPPFVSCSDRSDV